MNQERMAFWDIKTSGPRFKSPITELSLFTELGLQSVTIRAHSLQRWAASLLHYWSLEKNSKMRVKDGERDGHRMGGELDKEAWKGELYEGPEGTRGQIVGQRAWDAEEKKEDRNNEGWKESGDKRGMEKKEGAARRELSGAEETLGLGDCYAFILLCSRLLKHYLRKRL